MGKTYNGWNRAHIQNMEFYKMSDSVTSQPINKGAFKQRNSKDDDYNKAMTQFLQKISNMRYYKNQAYKFERL